MEFMSGDVPFGNEETSPDVVSGHPIKQIAFSCAIPYTFLSLTVSKRKNRCIPCAYLGTAIFIVVIEYCNLFPSFTLFLNCFHFTFGYELIVCSKSTSFMKIICNGLAFICRNKSLFLNLDKIYCFQGI